MDVGNPLLPSIFQMGSVFLPLSPVFRCNWFAELPFVLNWQIEWGAEDGLRGLTASVCLSGVQGSNLFAYIPSHWKHDVIVAGALE
jgi:hypothetical protein